MAPWNYSQYHFGQDGQGTITVDGVALIFYHFHQFQLLSNGSFDRLSKAYRTMGLEPEEVYLAYEAALTAVLREVRELRVGFSGGMKPALRVKAQRLVQYLFPESVKRLLKKVIKAV